jgi:hypothetical protein
LIASFQNDERGYRRWLRLNRPGYVFNHFGGSNPWENLLHKGDCDHLRRPEDEGRRTKVEKICSPDLRELEAEADRLRRSRAAWKRCEACR